MFPTCEITRVFPVEFVEIIGKVPDIIPDATIRLYVPFAVIPAEKLIPHPPRATFPVTFMLLIAEVVEVTYNRDSAPLNVSF